MRILFCGNAPIRKDLGASKVLIELARELELIGWETTVVGPDSLSCNGCDYRSALHEFLISHGADYDVVDYDHETLPHPRGDFPSSPLFVARSVLLVHHLASIAVPEPGGLRRVVGRMIHGSARRRDIADRIERAQQTIQQADLVNVSNHDDEAELLRHGVAPEKIAVLPFGLTEERRALFDSTPVTEHPPPTIAFVGTFDNRKGARDFPAIVTSICDFMPDARFLLLGTRGLFRTADEVRREFPRRLRNRLEIHERFDPDRLPSMLHDTSVGIFPSYIEGFGFGVLEMLAASIPVIAYRSPGPPMMLPAEWLVPRGDGHALAQAVIRLLRDPEHLRAERRRAHAISHQFSWDGIAARTSAIYIDALRARRGTTEMPLQRLA